MKRMLLTTLCYIEKGDQYLMLHRVKKEHDINKDKWIGVGGKFEDKESPEDCLLRECREDILPLAEFFRELANEELGRHTEGFDKEAEKELMRRMWAGNVRELKQTVRSAVLLTEGRLIGADRLEAESTAQAGSSLLLKDGNEERERIVRALAQADGNREMAAGLLGISRTTLYNKMKEYGIMQKKSEK